VGPKSKRAHFGEHRWFGDLVSKRLRDARQQLFLRIGTSGLADHPLFLGQLVIEQQRIVPDKFRLGR
jgi:hypothetical protein